MLIFWIEPEALDLPDARLVDAVDCFTNGWYRRMILSSSAAVEALLLSIVRFEMKRVANDDTVEGFLRDAATYAHQLGILVPYIATQHSFPLLPPSVVTSLRRMRELRNAIAHGRGTERPTHDDACNLLANALVATRYLSSLAQILLPQ